MAINSTRISSISSGFSRGEMQVLFPSNSSPSLYNYVANGIASGLTKNQILSAARYLSYVQGQGWDLETFSGTTYAKKVFASGSNSFDPGIFNGSSAQILIVAGGGSGGASHAGGGGAGGMIVHSNYVTTGTSTAIVGAGAPGPTGTDNTPGINGSNSSIYGMTAIGGGGGGTYPNPGPGLTGGNGGGGGIGPTNGEAPSGGGTNQGAVSGATVYGNVGGRGFYSSPYGGGGGGGASSAGQGSFAAGVPGNGGNGISYFGVTYAGGGGGMTHNGASGGSGGSGGGGAGGRNGAGTNGQANTGSGGGGSYSNANAGLGGSGIIIIRYPLTVPSIFGA